MKLFPNKNIDFYLDGKPYSTVNFDISFNVSLFEEPKYIGTIEAGYLRSGDTITGDSERITVAYQDGTTRKINYSWFD